MFFHPHRDYRLLAACCCLALFRVAPLCAGLTPRQEKAEYFRLIDFGNSSMLSHNAGFSSVQTQVTNAAALPSDDQALAVYASAMTNLLGNIPAHNYSCCRSRVLSDSAAFTTNFFSWLDLDHPGLEAVKANVTATNYPAALSAWRDYTVNKFRLLDSPQLYQQSYKSSTRQQNIASLMLGEKTYSQYLSDGTNTYGGIDFYEIYGMSGEPGTIGPISWTNQPPTTDTSLDTLYSYYQFFVASPLVYRYWCGNMVASGTNVTLTSNGTLVTARFKTPHGLADGDYVYVSSASPAAYNGLFRITVTGPTNATYTALSSPGTSPATGSSLAVAHSRQPKPVQKWFEVLSDFATRQKNMVSALQLVENTALQPLYRTVYSASDWSVTAGPALGQGDRLRELLAALAIFSKLLPEDAPVQRDWNTAVQDPVATLPASDATQVIPSEPMARISLSLMADNTEALMLAYYRVGMFPNQRLNGLLSLYLAASFFDEFKTAPELLRQTDAALTDFANTMFYPDGPMLERSPNYNEGDADKIRTLLGLSGTNATPGVRLLADKLAVYERIVAFMQTPLGGQPRMASYGGRNTPDFWKNSSALAQSRSSLLSSVAKNADNTATNLYLGLLDSGLPVPPATSVAFPYAGYYMQRNGWGSRAHYLYFANSPPGNGHAQMDHNGIQVCAFGRSLLSTAGPPPYGPTFVDPLQSGDYAGFALYQGEGSSFKVNTVAVDGRSQNESRIRNATVTTNTMPGAWFTSRDFDYVEGSYSAGYGKGDNSWWISVYDAFTNSSATVTSVTHTRSVMFLRTPGLWVVTDVLAATDTAMHDYRQIWNFPAFSATTGPTYGFTTNEVVADEAAHQIRTTDADGPNIRLYHLGPQAVKYETYSGCRTPYLGWTGTDIGGLRLPAANVHAVWQGTGTQMLVTVIAPSDTGAGSPVTAIRTNASSATAVDLELSLANGHTLRIVQGLRPQTLTVGNQSLSANTLIADAAPNGLQYGLALAATGLTQTNFSFTASPTNFTPLAAVSHPTNFNWTTDSDWKLPSTASPQNTPPGIAAIPDQRVAFNTGSIAVPFFVSDPESQATNLTVIGHSSDQALLPDASIVFSGTGTNRTVTLTPAAGRSGTATVSLTVTDPQGLSQTVSFTFNVFVTLYWDTSPAAGLQAGSGQWSGAATNWSSDLAGSTPLSAWPDNGNSAIFAGTNGAYTISVSGTQTVNDLLFSSAGYTVTGGALAHRWGSMTICADADATLNTPLSAFTNVIKTGTARLALGAANSYAGDTAVNAGTLQLAADNALPPTGGLTIGNGQTTGNLTLTNANQTVRWLTFAGATNAVTNRIEIADNRTLTVSGPLSVGGVTSNNTTLAEVTGASGTFAVTNDGACVQLGMVTSASNTNHPVLNLGGLGTFIARLGTNGILRVGENINDLGGGQATLLLASTNRITAGILGVGEGGRGYQQILKFGRGDTVINAGTINIGSGLRDSASVTFANTTGTLTLHGDSGTNRATLNLGTGGSTSGSGANNLLDLTGHFSDLLLSVLTLGEQLRTGTATHTISFNSGYLDVTGIAMARTKGSGTSTSTINLGGGAVTVGTGGILLASNAVGVLNITGGSVAVGGDILKGIGGTGAASLTLNGTNAVLDLNRHVIGTAADTVDASFIAGTLRNLGEFNGGADVVKGSAGILTLDGVNTYTGRTLVTNGTLRITGSLTGDVFVAPSGRVLADGGGTVTIGGAVTNNGVIIATNGTTISFVHQVVNNGTIDTRSGHVQFLAGVTGGGTLLSEPTWIIGVSGNLAFGNVMTGQTTTAALTITNSGNMALSVSGVSCPTGFSGPWSGSIASGCSTNVTVTFAPMRWQSYGGTVTVISDATSGTNALTASGKGIPVPSSQTIWASATDGAWTNDYNWTAGMPNTNTAYVTANTASYAIMVDTTPASLYCNLTVTNAAGRTTRLNVSAQDFMSTHGALTFGRGAEVYVNTGGIMRYTGRTPASVPFVEVKDGGVWRLNGGTVDFTNVRRTTPTSGSSYLYVGNNSTGRLEIASGEFVLTGVEDSGGETNNAAQLRIGAGTGGRGTLEMTGGKARFRIGDQGSSSFSVGSGSYAVGALSLTNDALLVVSNFVLVGTANSTGTVTVAGNAIFRHPRGSTRFQVGIENNAMGTVNVRDSGLLEMLGQDGMNLGGYQNNGRGVLNIDGGRVDAGAGVTLCRATGSRGGVGELYLNAGELLIGKSVGYGVLVGRGDGTAGAAARAYMTVSGGLLDVSHSPWNSSSQQNGIVLGLMGTIGNTSWSEVRFSGGTVTNAGQFILGAGLGATGLVWQTGGTVRQGVGTAPCFQMTVGWGGGYGSYTLSGGTFESAKPVYVGGLTAADLGYVPSSSFIFTNASVGTLRIDGGRFTVTNENLYLGRYGTGTLVIGTNGFCSARDIVLTNNTQSTLRFELGASGPGALTASGALIIRPGAKLEVDSTAYRGSAIWFKLVDCGARTTSFAADNITVTGPGVVRQDKDEDLWFNIRHGTIFLLY